MIKPSMPRVLSHFDVFIDGRILFGKCQEITLPVLERNSEDYRGSGFDAPIEIDNGMKKMECKFTMAEYDQIVMRKFINYGSSVSIMARGALTSGGISGYICAYLRGEIKKVDLGTWKVGENVSPQFEMVCDYFRLEQDGSTTVEIDIHNMIRNIGGTDHLSMARLAILKT